MANMRHTTVSVHLHSVHLLIMIVMKNVLREM